MTDRQFNKGDIIFKEGDSGECLYQIKEGVVGIYSAYGEADQQLLTELSTGKFFGEMAVIEAYPRSATAVALENVTAVEIESGEVSGYFNTDPDKILEIMKCLGGRLKELTDDYGEVSSAIEELRLNQDNKKSERLTARIKKFADVYRKNKNADKLSAESIRRLEQSGHADGYTTKVEGFSKNTVIFKEGEKGDCLYDIHGGSIGIYKAYGTPDEKLLTTLMPNQFFGELGMLEDDRRSGTAVAMENDTTLEIIYPDDLQELFKQNPVKVDMILEHVSYRLRRLTNEYMKACGILYKVSEAEAGGKGTDDRLKEEIKGYKESLYD